jgi:hypothetical protein
MNIYKHRSKICFMFLLFFASDLGAAEIWNQLLLNFDQESHKHLPELQYRHDLESGHNKNLFRYHYFHKFQEVDLIVGGAFFDNKKDNSERRTHQGGVFLSRYFEHRILMEQRDFERKTLTHRWRWRNEYKIPVKGIPLSFYDELFYAFNGQGLNEFRIGVMLAKDYNHYHINGGYSLFTF